ncbi:MAG: ATPase, T2SS/T4P/T4SS family [Bryobacteraceae bacterium]
MDEKEAALVEETLGAYLHLLAILPGNYEFSNRRKLVLPVSASAECSPIFAVPGGNERNKHLRDEYLLPLETNHHTVYYLNLHERDVLTALVIGSQGSGKTFFLQLAATLYAKYGGFVFVMDVLGNFRDVAQGLRMPAVDRPDPGQCGFYQAALRAAGVYRRCEATGCGVVDHSGQSESAAERRNRGIPDPKGEDCLTGILDSELDAAQDKALFEWERLRDDLQPIWHLIHDDAISEIQVNAAGRVFSMSRGVLRNRPEIRITTEQVNAAGHKIAARYQNTPFSRQYPIVDARLPDGSRVALVHASCSVGGPTMTIRKFTKHVLSLDEMVALGSLAQETRWQLISIIRERRNVLIAGATNSGKTTLLGALAREIDPVERILLVEGPSEIRLAPEQINVVRFEARHSYDDTVPEITQQMLCHAALRHSPNRVILGEIRRREEALELLQALNTGHEGSMSTIHADDCRKALRRFAHLIKAEDGFDVAAEDVADVIHYVIHLRLYPDGIRRVREVVRVDEFENRQFQLSQLYRYEQPKTT